jgi:hypothetical protein
VSAAPWGARTSTWLTIRFSSGIDGKVVARSHASTLTAPRAPAFHQTASPYRYRRVEHPTLANTRWAGCLCRKLWHCRTRRSANSVRARCPSRRVHVDNRTVARRQRLLSLAVGRPFHVEHQAPHGLARVHPPAPYRR